MYLTPFSARKFLNLFCFLPALRCNESSSVVGQCFAWHSIFPESLLQNFDRVLRSSRVKGAVAGYEARSHKGIIHFSPSFFQSPCQTLNELFQILPIPSSSSCSCSQPQGHISAWFCKWYCVGCGCRNLFLSASQALLR